MVVVLATMTINNKDQAWTTVVVVDMTLTVDQGMEGSMVVLGGLAMEE